MKTKLKALAVVLCAALVSCSKMNDGPGIASASSNVGSLHAAAKGSTVETHYEPGYWACDGMGRLKCWECTQCKCYFVTVRPRRDGSMAALNIAGDFDSDG